MKTITLPVSVARRNFTGLLKRLEQGDLDKVHIMSKGKRVADIIGLSVNSNPLANSHYEMTKYYADKSTN